MKVTILAVTSFDGHLTRGKESNIHEWTSKEDFVQHRKVLEESDAVVMGSHTFALMKQLRPKAGKLYVILTKSPEKFASQVVKDQLEFSDELPPALIKRLKKAGYKKLIVYGGGQVNGEFMSYDLVDEVILSIEPFAFGEGVNLFGGYPLNLEFKLEKFSKLNDRGTLLLHYRRAN